MKPLRKREGGSTGTEVPLASPETGLETEP